MPGHALVVFLQAVILSGSVVLAFRLHKTGLSRPYRLFYGYICFRIANSIWPFFFKVTSDVYEYLWVITTPIVWIFYILVVWELYGLILTRYKGIATLVRWAMYVGLMISVTVSILSLLPKFTPSTPQISRALGIVVATERGVTLCLALLLILMLLFLTRYPVPLGRNVLIHATLYTLFFLGNSMTSLLRSVFGIRLYTAFDSALMGLVAACIFGWLFLLTPKGEQVRVHVTNYDAEHELRLLSRLEALNGTMLKVGQK